MKKNKEKACKIIPEDFMKWKKEYTRPPEKISFEYSNVAVEDKDSCSACLSTVLMFLKRYQDELADYFCEDDPFRLAIGKAIGKQTPDAFL
ncbi:hypothetical protein ACFLR5_01820, partial [Elusimicrobiota bacterium]